MTALKTAFGGAIFAVVAASPLAAQSALCPPAVPGTATYQGISFVGGSSGYLDAEARGLLSQQVRGCPIAGTDPFLGAILVNQAYEAIPAPLAFARPLGTVNGQMQVELVEIRYGAVEVRGNDTTRADYVIARSGAQGGGLADVARLQDQLETLPEIEDIRVEADLEPGVAVGTSKLILTVQEPEPFRFSSVIDNYGAPSQGRTKATIAASYASLTGRRDPLSLIASTSEGTKSATLGYTTPLGTSGTRLSFGASLSRGTVVNDPILNGLTNETRTVSISVNHPLRASEGASDFLTGNLTLTDDTADFVGLRLVDQRIRELRIGSSHTRRWPGKAVLTFSHDLAFGLVDDTVAGVSDQFAAYRGFAAWTYKVSERVTGFSQLSWQLSRDLMPQALRFATTGPNNVRGYETNVGSADAGIVLRNQVTVSPASDRKSDFGASPYAFFDIGQGFDVIGGNSKGQGWLSSVGLGVSMTYKASARATISIDASIAQPLSTNTLATSRDPMILLQLSVRM